MCFQRKCNVVRGLDIIPQRWMCVRLDILLITSPGRISTGDVIWRMTPALKRAGFTYNRALTYT